MNVHRGDVVLVNIPFASGQGSKIRPVLVIQSNHNNVRLKNTLIAAITSNTTRAAFEATQFLIDVQTPEGRASGLRFNSAVVCEYLATVQQDRILKCLGTLPPTAMQQVDNCLRAALGLP